MFFLEVDGGEVEAHRARPRIRWGAELSPVTLTSVSRNELTEFYQSSPALSRI
jgi:hypothetical protein